MTEQTLPNGEKPFAFCQNCGKPLDAVGARVVGQAVFCEPCLAARLHGVPSSFGTGAPHAPYTPVNDGNSPFNVSSSAFSSAAPNPRLAALLGFIPGVGAMYNEQYAKGIIHLMVFAVLTSLGHVSDLFGFLCFGWICYMVIEAHHTARARLYGLPVPNPFGINELSDRLGFGRAWSTHTPPPAWQTPPAAKAGTAAATPDSAPPPQTPWTTPSNATSQASGFGQPYGGLAAPVSEASAPYAAYTSPLHAAYVPPLARRQSHFPTGAVWLIGLGGLFLLGTTGVFRSVPPAALTGLGLIGLSVWIFLRKMLEKGQGFGGEAGLQQQIRIVRALRVAVWVFLVGLFLILDSFDVLTFHRSWPWFVVLAGVMMLIERLVAVPINPPPVPPPYTVPPYPGTPQAEGTAQTRESRDPGSRFGGL